MKDLKIYAKTIDEKAKLQIDTLLEQPAFADCKVRIMPDVHAGAGCVIGFTANLGDKVIPNIVGVDIGCGMLTVRLGNIDIDYSELDRVIRECVPSGMAVHPRIEHCSLIDQILCKALLRNVDRLHSSLGTLGGGNHFIEIDADEKCKYLVIHTGSRNLGKQVADIYQGIAVKTIQFQKAEREEIIRRLKAEGREREISGALAALKAKSQIPRELCYLEGESRKCYLHDMMVCQRFARENRERIAHVICDKMGWTPLDSFHTVHNYIDDTGMVRKGAISAQKGDRVLIPINMRDGCIIGVGKGNEDWNCSAPHGAGRLMSRMQARDKLTLDAYKETMNGIYTTSVCNETIDEAPQAYKPMQEIVDCIGDTVEIERIIKPVYNFKAAET